MSSQKKKHLDNQTVTEYTAKLWKYRQVNQGPEPFRDIRSRAVESQGVNIKAAAIRGKKHCHDGKNRDDWFEIAMVGEWAILAAADGAGSCPFSRIGARACCRAAVSILKADLELFQHALPDLEKDLAEPLDSPKLRKAASLLAQYLQGAMASGYHAIEKTYQKRKVLPNFSAAIGRNITIQDFSSTLLVTIIIPVQIDGNREEVVFTCQIGDGLIVSFDKSKEEDAFCVLGAKQTGDFLGETRFLGPDTILQEELARNTTLSRRPMDHLFLMTDGVADDYYPEKDGLFRLYLDLYWNGVLKEEGMELEKEADTFGLAPIFYPSIRQPENPVGLFYTKKIQKRTGKMVQDLFQDRMKIKKAMDHNFMAFDQEQVQDKTELEYWLENYVERGSFDDRTLVVWSRKNVQNQERRKTTWNELQKRY